MRSFTALDADEFVQLVRTFPWSRQILEVHLHHTWRPSQSQYSGLSTIEGMWRYHTQNNGWSDIAQHVSTAPDGKIWVGRNFNWSPASASGHNGNSTAGPFMIEMIGDFDIGRDDMPDAQRDATLAVIRSVQTQFDLPPTALRFHNEMSQKTCPGSQADKAVWIAALEDFDLPEAPVDQCDAAFPEAMADQSALIASMKPHEPLLESMADADHPLEEEMAASAARELASSKGATSSNELSRSAVSLLADHVINLTNGKFSQSGVISTSEADVDRIIKERLASVVEQAAAKGKPARILLYAHGGLNKESLALSAALDQLAFWRANDVYPIFFVWETGYAETLKFMLRGVSELENAPRGMIREWLDDKVEDAMRFAGADRLWKAIKLNAELSNSKNGGATYTAKLIAKLVKDSGDKVELHLAGHSAGSNFMAHLLANFSNTPVKTVHLLAPAITNAQFHDSFAPAIGKNVDALTVYTMRKPLELADSVTRLYRKSLLYLISNALEANRSEPVLGLEESIRSDPAATKLFGLNGNAGGRAEIVWSLSEDHDTGNASQSRTHGDFDNDAATLQSICRRITDRTAGEEISEYQGVGTRSVKFFEESVTFPDDLGRFLTHAPSFGTASGMTPLATPPATGPGSGSTPTPTASQPGAGGGGGNNNSGRKLALCVGIDDYPHISKLECCRKDVEAWRSQLTDIGFDVRVIPQEEATSDGIKQRLGDFVSQARAGDQLVFQYSGHGTLISDASGDELEDSCLCAWDCNNPGGVGGLVLDDDLFLLMNAINPEAQLTGFIDCCHSGTMARALVSPQASLMPGDARARSVQPQPAMIAAYLERIRRTRSSAPPQEAALKAVFFNACQDAQVAYEFSGSGHFTRIAVPLLASAQGLSNVEFAERIIQGFGTNPRQLPHLHCDTGKRQSPIAIF